MKFPTDENVLVGLTRADDAGVYKVSEDLALIQTVDFFTPVVDDPYIFGQIAAANALSDVYAMGGTPRTAMNLVAFPSKQMDLSVLRQILQGGADKMAEAGVALMGGHSIEDPEIKYGLSVTGFIHPSSVLMKTSLRLGDSLILTKPLGIGIMNTAAKAGLVPQNTNKKIMDLMTELNRTAARIMDDFDVSACTDITGFGLAGHLAEMVTGSGLGARILADQIPIIQGAAEFADMGLLPTAAYNNKKFRDGMIFFAGTIHRSIQDILFDPQTSGGLLIAVQKEQAADLVTALKEKGVERAQCVGEIVNTVGESIHVL